MLGAVAWVTLPQRKVSYTTNAAQVEAVWRDLLPGAAIPVGFTGKLGIERQLVVLGGPRGQMIAVMAGTRADLERHLGPAPDMERRGYEVEGRAIILQGRRGDLPAPLPSPYSLLPTQRSVISNRWMSKFAYGKSAGSTGWEMKSLSGSIG